MQRWIPWLAVAGLFGLRAEAEEKPRPPLEVYGFAMGDLVEDFRRVDPNWVATLRPSKIPTHADTFGQHGEAVVSVRQSRLGVKTATDTSMGQIKTHIEFDFFGVGPDQGQTTIRLRHAFGELGMFGAGQTHSPFMDIDVFPNQLDYWGPCGMVFLRNPQLRFTPVRGDFELAFALEKPSNDIDPGQLRDLDPSLSANPHTILPDLSGHGRLGGEWGHVQLAGIVRPLGWEVLGTAGSKPNGTEIGWGVDLSGDLKLFGADRVIASVVVGNGIASYMNDGGVDVAALAPSGGGANTGTAVPLLGWVLFYERQWTKRWSTTLGYSQTRVENTNLQTPGAFKRGDYALVNLLVKPHDDVLTGVEVLWGRREDKDRSVGQDWRMQISLKYSFSKS